MPCEHCHKKPQTIFEQGKFYKTADEVYLCGAVDFTANVGFSYVLISLRDGNRWREPTTKISEVAGRGSFVEVKGEFVCRT